MNNTNTKSDNVELGAMWKKVSAKGTKFLTGVLNLKGLGESYPKDDINVVVFQNSSKTADNQPDLRVYLSNAPSKTKKAAVSTSKPVSKPISVPKTELVESPDAELV